jgi:hypothetical protein
MDFSGNPEIFLFLTWLIPALSCTPANVTNWQRLCCAHPSPRACLVGLPFQHLAAGTVASNHLPGVVGACLMFLALCRAVFQLQRISFWTPDVEGSLVEPALLGSVAHPQDPVDPHRLEEIDWL